MEYRIKILILIFISLIFSIIISLILGSVPISIIELYNSFFKSDELYRKIIFDIRLPRVLNAVLVGASLSCSGLILQSLLKNNLAEPGLLGISAAAGFGAICMFLLPFSIPFYFITPISFVFALIATSFVYFIAKGLNCRYTNFISSNKIILAGVAISAFLSSLNGFLLLISGNNASQILFWLSGGLSGRGWDEFLMTLFFVIIGLIAAFLFSKELNVLGLGEELSLSLGLNLKVAQKIAIIIASFLAASAVSVAGILSFIGLIIPNISKIIIGYDYKYSVPCSILLGALFMVIADTISRLIIAPAELPAGIIISFFGAPVFIWLIIKQNLYSDDAV
ncbi:MAG: iron ABC transporter permease [Ignavibacteria bacterium]|nr:iron ABC transporter permease [Ignavibacteria bacterium]